MSEILNQALLGELKEIMEDDFPSLLETFVAESSRQYVEASEAWKARDMEVLRRAAHSLKGSCGNIGAEMLQATCEVIEYSAKDGEVEDVPTLLVQAESQLAEVHSALQELH